MTIDGMAIGSLLVTRLQNQCEISNAKILADVIGYNDSPLFGGKKRKAKLIAELVMAETAVIIHAINQVFDASHAKLIIDPFLAAASQSVFSAVLALYPKFDSDYEDRMAEYNSSLIDPKPGASMSSAFIKNLGIDPTKTGQGQFLVSVHFTKSLSGSVDELMAFGRQSEHIPDHMQNHLPPRPSPKDNSEIPVPEGQVAQQKMDAVLARLQSIIDASGGDIEKITDGFRELRALGGLPDDVIDIVLGAVRSQKGREEPLDADALDTVADSPSAVTATGRQNAPGQLKGKLSKFSERIEVGEGTLPSSISSAVFNLIAEDESAFGRGEVPERRLIPHHAIKRDVIIAAYSKDLQKLVDQVTRNDWTDDEKANSIAELRGDFEKHIYVIKRLGPDDLDRNVAKMRETRIDLAEIETIVRSKEPIYEIVDPLF